MGNDTQVLSKGTSVVPRNVDYEVSLRLSPLLPKLIHYPIPHSGKTRPVMFVQLVFVETPKQTLNLPLVVLNRLSPEPFPHLGRVVVGCKAHRVEC